MLQLKNDQELNLIRITFGISFMDKILIVGANGSVGKSCVNNLKENNDLVLISRSEFDSDIEGNFEKNLLDINNYSETVNFINNIDYKIY